ncbi:MAG: GTP-dependent dephospho-CoA kinase family protein [Thermoplasmata archaeon]|nr:GTP-dependent dephospho-CoA kinase family protein [Thermoplasmata archaeon]
MLDGPEGDDRIRQLGTFGSCGDRVTADALRLGRVPFVAVVDGKTQRREPIDLSAFTTLKSSGYRRVRNPAGTLTGDLRDAVAELVAGRGGLIEVDGEEDLASLALVESLPVGATVIYGIPGAGVSFVTVDAAAKERVRALIGAMEFRQTDGA